MCILAFSLWLAYYCRFIFGIWTTVLPSSNFSHRYSLYVKEPEEISNWESFVKPFSRHVWAVLLGSFFGLGIFLAIVRGIGETACLLQHRHYCCYFRTSMLHVLQAFVQQGMYTKLLVIIYPSKFQSLKTQRFTLFVWIDKRLHFLLSKYFLTFAGKIWCVYNTDKIETVSKTCHLHRLRSRDLYMIQIHLTSTSII